MSVLTDTTLNSVGKTGLLAFDVAVILVFGFIVWKPSSWVSITWIKGPFTDDQLRRFYRWCSIVVIVGTLINSAFML